jgi:predicted metalloendopeptidase
MTHGFDSLGSQFDANGNYLNWWNNETKKTYFDKLQCMIKQYNKFVDTASELNANGTKTLNENTADNGK